MSKKKTPKLKKQPDPQRIPRVAAPEPSSYYSANPAWRVARMRLVDPHGWRTIDRDSFLTVLDRLKNLESMLWSEILVAGKKHNHTIKKDELEPSARDCLEEDWQGADEVVSLRVAGKQRVFGIFDRGTFNILWWDPEHLVCKSELKNT